MLFRFGKISYNTVMKKIFVLIFALSLVCDVYAYDGKLSKQATAFYSDNNHQKTMDLILQISEDDRTAQDWLLLGNVLADNGEIENAVFMYGKAISTDPKCYKAYYNLGNYYISKGKFNTAADNYKKALKIKKDNPYIYYNLACVNIKMEDYNQAKTNLNKAIMYKSEVPEFHYNLAYVYQKLNKPNLAETYLNNYKKLTHSL